jgi:outer membrane PBP1 activator LpoA protein
MRFLITIIALLILAACGPDITKTDQTENPDARISRLLDAREYQLAADESLKLSRLYPQRAVHYQQRAVEIYLQSGDVYAARAVLDDIKPGSSGPDNLLKRILEAKFALQARDTAKALSLLKGSPPDDMPENLRIDYFETRIQAYEQQKSHIEVVRDLISLSRITADRDVLRTIHERTWATLNKMNQVALRQYRASIPEMAGWLDLAVINQTLLFKPESLAAAVAMWKGNYPDHPANPVITDQILSTSAQSNTRPAHIALCLPFNGPYATASQAIREGFLAAWYTSRDYKPVVNIYDGDAVNINSIYSDAVAGGADLVVGPLEKTAITNLLLNGTLAVTTMALNQIDTPYLETVRPEKAGTLPKLIQFGLSPEDEARQVALRAGLDGYNRALVIIPDNERGDRLYEAFRAEWEDAGGIILEKIEYPENTQEFKTWVKSLLNANTSDKRIADLRTRLNRNIKGETRLRNDADVIFLAAGPGPARRIVPEFRFFQSHLPIYSTSDIYSGVFNPQLDKDLDDVIFNHMPWILDTAQQNTPLQQSINAAWSAEKSAYRNFYALGVDAYQLIAHLSGLALINSTRYPGATGELSMDENGRIQRKLMWAKFSAGSPVALDQNL